MWTPTYSVHLAWGLTNCRIIKMVITSWNHIPSACFPHGPWYPEVMTSWKWLVRAALVAPKVKRFSGRCGYFKCAAMALKPSETSYTWDYFMIYKLSYRSYFIPFISVSWTISNGDVLGYHGGIFNKNSSGRFHCVAWKWAGQFRKNLDMFVENTLLLCQHSYWTWPFIVDLPIENGDFP